LNNDHENLLSRDAAAAARIPLELVLHVASAEACFAALSYGADTVLLGLRGHCSGSGVELGELDAALGHAQELGRRLLVLADQPVAEGDWPALLAALAALEERGAAAVLLADLGLLRAMREHFPRLRWHGAARLEVRGTYGVQWAARNGFERVALPPGVSAADVALARAVQGVDLCVSLAAPPASADVLRALALSGASAVLLDAPHSMLYAAATAHWCRLLLDGARDGLGDARARLDTLAARYAPAAGATEGVTLGVVTRRVRDRAQFVAVTDFERHDGVLARRQDDPPGRGLRFSAERINLRRDRVVRAAPGQEVSMAVPEAVREGDELRLVNSRALERVYPVKLPRRAPRARFPVHVELRLGTDAAGGALDELGMRGTIDITGRVYRLELQRSYPCKLLFADTQPVTEERLREHFEHQGAHPFRLASFRTALPAGVFVPASQVNEARRLFFAELEGALQAAARRRVQKVLSILSAGPSSSAPKVARISARVKDASWLESLPWNALEEAVLEVDALNPDEIARQLGRQDGRLRLALPAGGATHSLIARLCEAGARRFLARDFAGLGALARAAGLDKARPPDTVLLLRRPRELKTRTGGVFEPDIPDFGAAGLDVALCLPPGPVSREAARSWLEQGVSRLLCEDAAQASALLPDFGPVLTLAVDAAAPAATRGAAGVLLDVPDEAALRALPGLLKALPS
jgi:hypothetical protein